MLRLLLRPLKAIERQATAICNREFPLVDRRPFTTEFRRVVDAMNWIRGNYHLDHNPGMPDDRRDTCRPWVEA